LRRPGGPAAAAVQVPPRPGRGPAAGRGDGRTLRGAAAAGHAAAGAAAPRPPAPARLRPGAGAGPSAGARAGPAAAHRGPAAGARHPPAAAAGCRRPRAPPAPRLRGRRPAPPAGARGAGPRRGYDQALELARPLARALDLPLLTGGLRRVRATRPQSQLDAAGRARNLRDAFAVDASRPLPAHVVLVDDVMTTGATLHAAARAL